MNRGEFLMKVIEEKGFNVMSLSKATGVSYTTIRSMIERDLKNASIDNVLKICKVLGISADSLAGLDSSEDETNTIETIAAHHEGDEWTEEELQDIEEFKEFVRMRRKQRKDEGK